MTSRSNSGQYVSKLKRIVTVLAWALQRRSAKRKRDSAQPQEDDRRRSCELQSAGGHRPRLQ